MVGLGASTQDIFPSISEKVMRTGTQTRRATLLNKRLSQLCEKHCAKQQAKCQLSRSPEKEQVDGFLSQTGRREVLFRARMRQIGRVQLEARAKRHGYENDRVTKKCMVSESPFRGSRVSVRINSRRCRLVNLTVTRRQRLREAQCDTTTRS
jgi:hypothetical protein